MKEIKQQNNSMKRRILSFVYAYQGIKYFITSQINARIHIIAGIVVLGLSIWLPLSGTEWCLIVLAIGLVLMSELFNTAFEVFIDYISPSYNVSAGRSKDLAAGGVLFAAITAAVIGLIIFVPKIFDKIIA